MNSFGLLVVDKPVGPTSHKVVSIVRQGSGERKVGHAGTLDPRASGVLVLCLGPATRLSEFLSTASKRYEATIRFGYATRTYDSEGEVSLHTGQFPSAAALKKALGSFQGEIQQVPPPYSAIKLQGRKAYELAREGQDLELEARTVSIHQIEILAYDPPDLSLLIECSAGTYIRSLANDLGELLSTGAHLAALRRTKAGPFDLGSAVALRQLEDDFVTGRWERHLLPAADALPELPIVPVSAEQIELIRHGRQFAAEPISSGLARAIGPDGTLVAILEPAQDGLVWHPRKVFIC